MIQDFISSHKPECQLRQATNGDHGIKVLEELYGNNTLPSLIISDLNMPIMDGLETYNVIKNDERFANIPVIIFTTSSFSKSLFLKKGITAFTKPFCIIEFEKVIIEIVNYSITQ